MRLANLMKHCSTLLCSAMEKMVSQQIFLNLIPIWNFLWGKLYLHAPSILRHNQSKLRKDDYVHLHDAINQNDAKASDLAKVVVLPSSFTVGPRCMHERTQDVMSYVRYYGRPDLFTTLTCNPKWTEIQEQLAVWWAGCSLQDINSGID